MWVGLTREGFLEEGSQDPGDGDEREAVASGRSQPLQVHMSCSCVSSLRASLSTRSLGKGHPGYDLPPSFEAEERAGIGGDHWAPGPAPNK